MDGTSSPHQVAQKTLKWANEVSKEVRSDEKHKIDTSSSIMI